MLTSIINKLASTLAGSKNFTFNVLGITINVTVLVERGMTGDNIRSRV